MHLSVKELYYSYVTVLRPQAELQDGEHNQKERNTDDELDPDDGVLELSDEFEDDVLAL
jgi:hypothetical protein